MPMPVSPTVTAMPLRTALGFEPDTAALGRELDGVGKKVEENLAQLGGIADQCESDWSSP